MKSPAHVLSQLRALGAFVLALSALAGGCDGCDTDVGPGDDGSTPQARCDDGAQNGTETDTDCGGSCATKCADGAGCALPSDCVSGVCTNGACEPLHTLGGTVTGLAGSGLVLEVTDGEALAISEDGAFAFTTRLPSGTAYAITVSAQPTAPNQTCTVTNDTGTIGSANVTNVTVACTTNSYTVGGTVAGLLGSGLVLALDGDELPVAMDGSFVFTSPVESGAGYVVTVATQPTGPSQTCTVSGGTGTVVAGEVTSVTVNCATNTYTIGGTTTGLLGTVILRNNGGDDLELTSTGTFAFSVPLEDQASYDVTILSQPGVPSQTCTITNGTGALSAANVTDVELSCVTNTFEITGEVIGLVGSGLVLQNDSGDDLAIDADGSFTFDTEVASGATYVVTVLTNPTGPSQTCVVSDGAGMVGAAAVTDVVVTCTTNTYTIGGTIDGLVSEGLVLTNAGGDDISPASGETTFAFSTPIASGSAYNVVVAIQPTGQTCAVTNGSGTVTDANVVDVEITCMTCGDDCFGPFGCLTGAGRCVKFSCRPGDAGGDFCESCNGWSEISVDQWLNQGYCGDIIAKYRQSYGQATHCGGAPTCCGSSPECGGGDNAWHFFDGTDTRYVGPCLGCANDANCTYWNGVDNGTYTRITACERL